MTHAIAHDHFVWIAYVLGFALTLLFKWAQAAYLGGKQGKSVKQVTCEWFFEPSLENASSWTATIGGVWVLGSIYINGLVKIAGISDLPVDESIAFLFGSLFEFTVPAIIKWMVSKLPFPK
jgi:hypothetical protein